MRVELDPKTVKDLIEDEKKQLSLVKPYNFLCNSAAYRNKIKGVSLPENKSFIEDIKRLKRRLQEREEELNKRIQIEEKRNIAMSSSESDDKKDEITKELERTAQQFKHENQLLQNKINEQKHSIQELIKDKQQQHIILNKTIKEQQQTMQELKKSLSLSSLSAKKKNNDDASDEYREHRFRTLQKTIKDHETVIKELKKQIEELKQQKIQSMTTASSSSWPNRTQS